jgi:hypothetical protein
MVAAVDDKVGLQFHVDGAGLVGAEMVALSEDAVNAGQAAEERICTLVDEVVQALNARQCGIRERFRSSLTPHEQLRVVHIPVTEQVRQFAEAPKQMRIE